MMGIPRDFVLLNCAQDFKLDASSNQKLLACVQNLWLLFSFSNTPAPPDPNILSSWKSLVPDLKSVVRAPLYSKKWLSLICHSVTQPLVKHIRAAPLSQKRHKLTALWSSQAGGRNYSQCIFKTKILIHRKI